MIVILLKFGFLNVILLEVIMLKDILLNVVLLNGILLYIICQNDVSLIHFSSLLGRRGKEVPLLPQDLEVPSSIQPKGSTKMEKEQFIF
jgi:hypothetical protein